MTELSETKTDITIGTYPLTVASHWAVGQINSEQPLLNTLTITQCNSIRLQHKETEIDFEFDTKKLENIDTIIINGFKYIKEK